MTTETRDCDVSAIDKPFLEGMAAFIEWMMSPRNTLPRPDNPYSCELAYCDWDAWEIGWDDAENTWLSWQ